MSSRWDVFWGEKFPERPYIPAGHSRLNKTGRWKVLKPIFKYVEKCTACDLCWIFCPEGTIRRDKKSAIYAIDYEYCKGCGICAEECPRGVIEMVRDVK